ALPFADLPAVDLAHAAMIAGGEAPQGVCVKPVTGICGLGFRRLDDDRGSFERLFSADPADLTRMALAAFRAALAGAEKPREMILMAFLPGPERSIDFACHEGRLLAAVARVKAQHAQRLEYD